ncbi:class I SAM-dependent methyltransferase [Peribacillus alkalitolerans]|uniref:class I SAM-dependent methyltransferase n=1 Tax=Peribacillus alkalitolerans TaxID=1550385 RepID=UPI001F0847AB|nr:class I SAM-dependent methyltransferase [Peribacillus alkalitolerans]
MNITTYQQTIRDFASILEEANIPYTFIGEAALTLQGVPISESDIQVIIQWDVLDSAYSGLSPFNPSPISKDVEKAEFRLSYQQVQITISCFFNTTVKTDPYRIGITLDGKEVFCRSFYSGIYEQDFSYQSQVADFLLNTQKSLTEQNEQAWNQNNYTALIHRYGEPGKIAAKIKQNPKWRLHPFYKYMKDLKNNKVLHLLGSNGVKATAMALLGADVTVADFSKENASFAKEVAAEAGVDITYIVSDALSLSDGLDTYDYVLMELGVLHYFISLDPLMEKVKSLLASGGVFILHEFHPISTKLITSNGKKHRVVGNYFDPTLQESQVAFSKHMPDEEQGQLSRTIQRKWTLGEVVTSVAKAGLFLEILEEEPNHKLHDIGLPKTYTLVARKR